MLMLMLNIDVHAGATPPLRPRASRGGAGKEGRPHPPLLRHQLGLPGSQHDVEEDVKRRPAHRLKTLPLSAGDLVSSQQRLHLPLHREHAKRSWRRCHASRDR